MTTSNLISLSRDFKKQYHSRPKETRWEIDSIIKKVEKVTIGMKDDIPFRKIKMTVRISESKEELVVYIMPNPRIIIKRIV